LGFSEGYYHRSLKPFIRKDERRFTPTVLLRVLEGWMEKNSDARFFLYVHFGPPHRPYEQPAQYTQLFEKQAPPGFIAANYTPDKYLFPLQVEGDPADRPPLPEWINLYDANLRYGDWAIGEVKKLLEKHGIYEKTILIITSDHGESFGEHGFVWHAGGIYNEATHIPLLIRLPKQNAAAKRIGALTQTIDILPTVYDLLQIPFPKREVQGQTLLPLMSGSKQSVREMSFTRSDGPPKYMVRDLHNSLLVYANPQWRALYNTDTDPEFKKNIIAAEPQKAQALYQTFLKFANAQKYPPAEFSGVTARRSAKRDERNLNLTPEMQRDLKSLGYLK
jgi:arylsulfatase A-like enzyme